MSAPAATESDEAAKAVPSAHAGALWADPNTLRTAAYVLAVAAGSWWLLGQLAGVLRPLMLAVFLGYVLLPYYRALRVRLTAPVAIVLLAGLTTAGLLALALAVYGSLLGLQDELPRLKQSAVNVIHHLTDLVTQYVPGMVPGPDGAGGKRPEDVAGEILTEGTLRTVKVAADGFVEALAVGLYLLFLLLESARFPDRVRSAYPPDRAEQILDVAGRINSAIVSYLKAKVKSSLALAAMVGVVMAVFGVRFGLLWVVVTFLCNFIPYVGSVVAYLLPAGFAFLQYDLGYQSVAVAVLLLAAHLGSASLIEPMFIGRAVGLSPLVILAALSVWGLMWGLPGMFLAVPLTVVLRIVFENIEATRPVARLLTGE
ncbi:AI-2E family transporter [Fimbriiglobus ruber]|uniref:Transport protein n=1 Tax=Fimbriiglobus ruber TaxID=1908690 RepID=A0A225DME4_9BACT|nr:AI-2E family transporter [Fimbriiglobus ruber]OWK38626.1 transport protein [Fimbriiglobus ruber]